MLKMDNQSSFIPTGMSNLIKKVTPKVERCSSLVIFPSSMKTIPFTVPTAASPMNPRRADTRFGEETGSTGSGGSEPGSPSTQTTFANGKGSLDSLNEIRGAHALGTLDPSIYKVNEEDDTYDIPDNHIGRIWFAVEYERESEKLMVSLLRAKNLPSRSTGSLNACDPFVRIYLMPDERRYLQSKFKKKTSNPKFDESFVFQVSNKAIDERVLKLTVFDVDRHRRHQVIGHALYPLREHNYGSDERVVMWRDLEKEISETPLDKGDIHVALCYNNHLERLTVGLFEGKDFCKNSTTAGDFYIKVCLQNQNKVVKSKRTEVVKKTASPSFNESFTFKIPVASLDSASIILTAMQYQAGKQDRQLGRIILGSFMFARGKELEHWNRMVAEQREQVSDWHTFT